MIDIEQAIRLINQSTRELAAEPVELPRALGHVLAEDVVSPIDSPPFDKSMMDGFAIRAEDVSRGEPLLLIVDRVMAGAETDAVVSSGTAVQVMTGAPIPAGADAVVMVENTSELENDLGPHVLIREDNCRVGQNILRRADTMRQGEQVISRGHLIEPKDVGVLAEMGRSTCQVVRRPTVAILATGDELVPTDVTPGPSQIRNSNGPMLLSLCHRLGLQTDDLGIAKDDNAILRERIERGLSSDVLVLTGGVSAGVADLVPGILGELGVRTVFHKVNIKPGKPVWYGVLETGERIVHVFGLPGNPVSSLVCFQVFTAEAIRKLAGQVQQRDVVEAVLTRQHQQRGDRTTYWPSVLSSLSDGNAVEPLDWKGSADLKTLVMANALAVFPAKQAVYKAGAKVRVMPL